MPVRSFCARPGRAYVLKDQDRGFSLIELLLVVVLMVTVAGLSIPNLPKQFSSMELSAAARQLSSLMRYAQSLAVVHQKEYRLCFSTESARYWLEQKAADDAAEDLDEALDGQERFEKLNGPRGKIFSFPRGISLDAEQDLVRFYPDGTMDRARIMLTNANKKTKIISTQERRGQVDVLSAQE